MARVADESRLTLAPRVVRVMGLSNGVLALPAWRTRSSLTMEGCSLGFILYPPPPFFLRGWEVAELMIPEPHSVSFFGFLRRSDPHWCSGFVFHSYLIYHLSRLIFQASSHVVISYVHISACNIACCISFGVISTSSACFPADATEATKIPCSIASPRLEEHEIPWPVILGWDGGGHLGLCQVVRAVILLCYAIHRLQLKGRKAKTSIP